jgi:hypothetical protein
MRTSVGRSMLVTGLLLMVASAAVAQPRMDPEERLNNTMAEVTEAVGLSEEQATAIRPIMAAEFEKQMELFTAARESGAGFEGVREEMVEIQAATDTQVAALLTEDQVEKWGKWREDMASRRRQRRGGGG